MFETLDSAGTARSEMLRNAGANEIARGDRVVDVVDD